MTDKKSSQTGRIVGWGGIIAAIIFFFNPDIGIIDILPDFLGFILLCASIKKIAGIDDRVSEARELFRRMIYLTLVKFILIFVMFGFIPTTDQSVSMLMFTFIFSVLEIVTVVPAVIKLYDGILYLSSRHEGEAAFRPAKKRKRSRSGYEKTVTEKVRNITVAFIIIKSVCRTLPEFAALTEQTYDETAAGQLYLFKDLFREFGVLIALIAALIWIIPAIRYVNLLRRDKKLLENLSLIYKNEVLTKTDRLARSAVRTAFGYFGAAAVLTLDFYIDNINILPDILSALCAIAGLLLIRKYVKGWKIGIAVSGIYGILSLAADAAGYYFNTNYYPEAIMRDEETYNAFIMVCGINAAVAAAFIAFAAVLLFVVTKDIIINHTGFSMTTNDTYNPAEKVRLLHISLIRKLTLPMVFASLAAVIFDLSELYIGTFNFLWFVQFLLSGLFAYSFIKNLMEINEQISYKYMLS